MTLMLMLMALNFMDDVPKIIAIVTPVGLGFFVLAKWAFSMLQTRGENLTKREQSLSEILIGQLKTQSDQINQLRGKLDEVGISADKAYNEANHGKLKLEELRAEGLETNKVIAEKQQKKDDFTDAQLATIERTASDTHNVAINIDRKIEDPHK